MIIALLLAVGLYLMIKTMMMSMARVKLSEPTLTASVYPLRPDESFQVHYRQRAKQPVDVDRITVRLVCRKSDTYNTVGDCGATSGWRRVTKMSQEIIRDTPYPSSGISGQANSFGYARYRCSRARSGAF